MDSRSAPPLMEVAMRFSARWRSRYRRKLCPTAPAGRMRMWISAAPASWLHADSLGVTAHDGVVDDGNLPR